MSVAELLCKNCKRNEWYDRQVEGAVTVQPYAEPVAGFEEYFLRLTPSSNRRNPWFAEYWEDYFRCRMADDLGGVETPFNQNYSRTCDVITERQTVDNGFELEAQLQFVSDAVLAFAHALKVTQSSRHVIQRNNWMCVCLTT